MAIRWKKQWEPYIGFEFNGVHSSQLNIKRVSSGDRYNLNIVPQQEVITNSLSGNGVEVARVDLLGKEFNVNIAFDSMTEENFQKLYSLFTLRKLGELVFDETPYKKYKVSINSPPQIKWICFFENGKRIYKGEGNINFTSYLPYAEMVSSYIEDYIDVQLTEDGNIDLTQEEINYLQKHFMCTLVTNLGQIIPYCQTGSNQFFLPHNRSLEIIPTIYLHIDPLNQPDTIGFRFLNPDDQGDNGHYYTLGLSNLNLKPEDEYLIINLRDYVAYGVMEEDGILIANGNNYINKIWYNFGHQKSHPIYWRLNGVSDKIYYPNIYLGQAYYERPRIEVGFYTSSERNDSNEIISTENYIYDVKYINKVY